MEECINFSSTLKVARGGDKIWLGTVESTPDSSAMILVTYYLNGEEISDFFAPIIDGLNVYLDLSIPDKDYYSQFNTYYISLTSTGGYFSGPTQVLNDGTLHDGFIVNFSDSINSNERLITT